MRTTTLATVVVAVAAVALGATTRATAIDLPQVQVDVPQVDLPDVDVNLSADDACVQRVMQSVCADECGSKSDAAATATCASQCLWENRELLANECGVPLLGGVVDTNGDEAKQAIKTAACVAAYVSAVCGPITCPTDDYACVALCVVRNHGPLFEMCAPPNPLFPVTMAPSSTGTTTTTGVPSVTPTTAATTGTPTGLVGSRSQCIRQIALSSACGCKNGAGYLACVRMCRKKHRGVFQSCGGMSG